MALASAAPIAAHLDESAKLCAGLHLPALDRRTSTSRGEQCETICAVVRLAFVTAVPAAPGAMAMSVRATEAELSY